MWLSVCSIIGQASFDSSNLKPSVLHNVHKDVWTVLPPALLQLRRILRMSDVRDSLQVLPQQLDWIKVSTVTTSVQQVDFLSLVVLTALYRLSH